tara:strand:- start:144 stop:644 length:501 start_codon:yes stop_codon:yes gene_type:complete
MRRVKSAPSNIANMSHKKKNNIIPSFNLISENIINKPQENNNINIKNKNIYNIKFNIKINEDYSNKYLYKTSLKDIKDLKNKISFNSNIINDIINDYYNLNIEDSTIIFTIINFLSNNILKREKLNELYIYLLQAIIRYIIMFILHTVILHQNIDNSLINIFTLLN